ncbi:hypothetical protein DT250_28455 [Bacillus sp. AR2-1]|nr:hypothetical protein DT250_28455 [Bacillus sp. AR2-1]OTY00458.1 hypothetical protein BK729_09350 [Bacillus thuringiensis serovar wratislaviensis]
MKQNNFNSYILSSKGDILYFTNIKYSPEERPFFIIVSQSDLSIFIVPKLEVKTYFLFFLIEFIYSLFYIM